MQCDPVRSILSFGVRMRAVILPVTVLTSTESIAKEKLDFVFFDATGRLYQTSKLAEGLADQGGILMSVRERRFFLLRRPH